LKFERGNPLDLASNLRGFTWGNCVQDSFGNDPDNDE